MKKIIFTFAFVVSMFLFAQKNNTLLNQDFWKNKPNLEQVQQEIKAGNGPSESNPNAMDVVTTAIMGDAPLDVIKFLIDQPGNKIDKLTHDSRIYLHWAAMKGNVELVQYLIQKGSDVQALDSHDTKPTSFAASNGQTNPELYEAFFKAGVDPKQKYSNGANLLLLAMPFDKDLKLATYFETKGLSIKDTDNSGQNAFDYASRNGQIEILKALISKGIKPTDNALLIAAQGARRESNTIEIYQYLINDLNVNVNAKNEDGENALHLLAKKPKQSDIIKFLLDKKTDANLVDVNGNTPFIDAGLSKDYDNLKVLFPVTKNINAVNNNGNSALTNAVDKGAVESVSFLLENKADAKILDNSGNNLLYYLVQSYSPRNTESFDPKLKLLEKYGISPSENQKNGGNILLFAVAKNDLNLVEKVLNYKPNINAQDVDGISPLHKAAMVAKDDKILKLLVENGAKKGLKTEFDETAYDLAAENEFLKKQKVSIDFLK